MFAYKVDMERAYQIKPPKAHANTGDALSIVARHGLPTRRYGVCAVPPKWTWREWNSHLGGSQR